MGDKVKGKAYIFSASEMADAKERVSGWIEQFLDDWQQGGVAALAATPEPSEPVSSAYWYVALGGNLMWATAVFFPESLLIAVPLSYIGAYFGSGGAAAPFLSDPSPPSAKEFTGKQLAMLRDDMQKTVEDQMLLEWATYVASPKGETPPDLEARKMEIWKEMFPKVPYGKRNDYFYDQMLGQIKSALPQFNRQWKEWYSSRGESCVEARTDYAYKKAYG